MIQARRAVGILCHLHFTVGLRGFKPPVKNSQEGVGWGVVSVSHQGGASGVYQDLAPACTSADCVARVLNTGTLAAVPEATQFSFPLCVPWCLLGCWLFAVT